MTSPSHPDSSVLAIKVTGLSKSFGRVKALDELDLQVHRGEVLGFLGPNGSGKSTTIRVLLGLIRADAGQVTILGGDPWREAVRIHRSLAYVPGDVELWPNLTGGETIDLLARLRGSFNRERRDELIERFKLDPSKKAGTYSKGNRQKVALISALASDAELFVFDEPTSGLDPLMEIVFQDAVREANSAGVTVLLSSHILAQVESLADRVSIIREGRTVETGTLSELRHLTRTTVVAEVGQPAERIADLPGVHGFEAEGGRLRFEVDGDQMDAVVRSLASLGVRSLVAHPPTLEQLLMRYYGTDLSVTDIAEQSAYGNGHD